MAQEKDRPFRIVVVGAGIVGLTLSHALQLANIDHIVLEKHEKIVSLGGAALVIWPPAARVFDQFGILKGILEKITPRWPDGTVHFDTPIFTYITEKFDTQAILFNRQKCVEHLYDSLPDKSRIRTRTRVERVEHTEDGVRVITTDGKVEECDLVIGADGVHSLVRQQMWEYASKYQPGVIPASDKTAFASDFAGIFGVTEITDDLNIDPAEAAVTCGNGTTSMLFTQPGQAYWALVFREEHCQPPKRQNKSEAAMEETAERFKDIPIKNDVTFGDLWKGRTRAGLLTVEEGILDRWHAGRMVLCGDSAHKMTADAGMGANTAIESAVGLCNVLQRELKSNPNRHFSQAELSSLLDEYQESRMKRAKLFTDLSAKVTRLNSYSTPLDRFISRYLSPLIYNFQIKQLVKLFAGGPKLDYVPTRTINEDAEGWKLAKKGKDGENASSYSWHTYLLAFSVLGLGLSFASTHLIPVIRQS